METEKETSSPARNALSPLALLGILVSSIGIIGWFRSKLKSPGGKARNRVDDQYNAEHPTKSKSNMPSGTNIADPHNPTAVHPFKHVHQKQKHWYQRWKFYGRAINFLTLVAVVWYACITRGIWLQMIEADRPWLGPTEAGLRITANQEVLNQGQKQIRSNIDLSFRNGGKSPASIEVARSAWHAYATFPKSPEFTPCSLTSSPETKALIPGSQTGFSCVYVGQTEITENLYAFAEIQYRDIRTNKTYYSHFCKRYDPATLGWTLCPFYNDSN